MKKIGLGIFLIMSLNLNAAYEREAGTCLPVSSITYEMGNKSNEGLSETEYNQVLDQVQTTMGPEIKKVLNKNLIIDRRWSDPTIDAFATRDDANNPVIVMNGGLARHPLMTRDGFLLLVCHEIGHHLGGAPKILRGNSGLKSWSSAEGQADYYATSKCLPLFFHAGIEYKNFDKDNDANSLKLALSKCRDNVCARIVLSGLSVSHVFSSLLSGTPTPSLLSSDPTKVDKTLYNHPNPQCRLDTFLSGANCDVGTNIPFDNNDPRVGACLKDQGQRPMCWFQEKDFF
jgi:hypothetical protein